MDHANVLQIFSLSQYLKIMSDKKISRYEFLLGNTFLSLFQDLKFLYFFEPILRTLVTNTFVGRHSLQHFCRN